MVATGDVRSFPARVQITGMGSSTWDGWQVVARYPASLLQSGVGHYAFLVRGMVGEVFELSGTPVNAAIEITIATAAASGGGIDQIARSHIVRLPATAAAHGRFQEGIPFGFVAAFDTLVRRPNMVVDPDIGSSWPARDLLVIARTFLNGDPPSVAVRFSVADLFVMHWDFQRMPNTHSAVHDFAPPSPIQFNEQRQLLSTYYMPPTLEAQTWILWHWLRYLPGSSDNAARFEMTIQEDGGAVLPYLGGHRMGHVHRGSVTGQTDLGILVFRPIVRQPGVGVTITLWASGGRPGWPAQHSFVRWRIFGVLLEGGATCSYPAVFSEDREAQLARPAPNPAAWFWERPRADRLANLVVLAQASAAWDQPQVSTHDVFLTDDDLQPYRQPTMHGQANGPWGEGSHALVVSRRIRSNNDFRWRTHLWERPPNQSATADGVDLAIAEWTFETNPSNEPLLGPQPPAPFQIVPAREALAANYLPVPPHDVYDADGWTEEPVDNQRRFEADSGLMRTWPVWLGVKSVWTFTRTGLTRTQRDDMLAFYKVNTNFRVRLPRRKQDTACKVFDRPRFEDRGGVYTMSLRAIELIQIGGMP